MIQRFSPVVLAALLAATPAFSSDSPATASGRPGVDALLESMDPTADPCDDFYRYACGGWLDATELPSDEPRWNRSFSVVHERNREILRAMVEDAAAHPGEDMDRKRIGGFYGACMDEEGIEKAGADPLRPALDKIAAVKSTDDLFRVAGELNRQGVGVLFGAGILPDFQDPERNIGFLSQGGLGLPDRDFYLSEDEKKTALRSGYRDAVTTLLGLLGDTDEQAAAAADRILAFETRLAEASRSREEMRQVERLYNKLDLEGLVELTPELPWKAWTMAIGHPDFSEINVGTPEFFEGLQASLAETDATTWRDYLRWHLVLSSAPSLSSAFVDAEFDFFDRQLAGRQEMQPRWKRCLGATEGALGEVLGRLYVAEHFAGDSKKVALEMIHDVEDAFAANLADLAWMDDTTRGFALAKMEAVSNKIGYPDDWRDYSALEIDPKDHFGNLARSAAVDFDFQFDKHGQPVDDEEWFLPPQTVNAFYNPLGNEIVFPAGILQPPFFSHEFPAAMNYGGIGSAMGHELTHGFDDSGRKFDPDGKLREWWAPEVSERFEERAACIEELYDGFEIEPDLNVNGKLTLGENIADVGGVKQAFLGYRAWVERHGEPEPFAEGIGGDQVFFLAMAQNWCTVQSPENARLLATTDSHSPGRFRVLGTLSQVPAFATAFRCEAGKRMAPKNRCEVW